ncbi:MAG: GMC family oxidoreductase [Pseudomonadota bacterium]
MSEDVVDVLIIGAGATGAAAAWNLADTRMRIVCMDQGDWMHSGDYPSNFQHWEHLRSTKWSSSPNLRNFPADYPINDTEASPISIVNFNGVGGSTVLYAAHFPRFHPSDFRVKTLDGVADDWPIDYATLEPFYAENDRNIGVSGLAGDPAYPPKTPTCPPLPIGEMGNIIGRGFNKLGWHWWPSDAAIVSEPYGGRDKCINLGPCISGCAQGAKSSADVTYWPLAIQRGVELRTRCRVREITIDSQGMATGVIYYDAEGNERHQRAEVVILACNGVGTPRLLLNSVSARFPDGLANSSGLVGKNLMLHPWGIVHGVFEEGLASHLGPQGTCLLSQEFYETRPEHNFVRGFGLQITRGSSAVVAAQQGMATGDIPWGQAHHDAFRQYYGSDAYCGVCVEDLPELTNTVTLDPKICDSHGIPAPKITYRLGENSQKMLDFGLERGRELMEAAGAWRINSFGPMRYAGWHLMGTARMGTDPTNAVVNEWGRCHDVRNLFIVDGSIFVTSAAGNPTTTMQALALYITDKMKQNLANLFD